MKRLRQKYGIPNDYDRYSQRTHPAAEPEPGAQMKLF
jgi:hypothetical protein